MTTIILSSPAKNGGEWAVLGTYEGRDEEGNRDGYVFGIRKFAKGDGAKAEAHARRMMEAFGADHFARC
jgi:hypothetical protein